MQEKMPNSKFKKLITGSYPYWFYYSLVFILTFCGSFFYYYFKGRMLNAGTNSIRQSLISMMYISDYYRQLFKNLFIHHKFAPPMWDMSIGYGADVLTTLHYYGLTDPLVMISAIVSRSHIPVMYCFIYPLKLYLTGVAFSIYARHKRLSRFQVLSGALLYSFCAFAINYGITMMIFLTPMIYLPLILSGADRILE